MPKGYNKDGSKKVRPAGSGRKAVPSKAISPQITLEAAAILATVKNQNRFISQAILEKAQNDAIKKITMKKEAEKLTPGQIDLIEMLQEIKAERKQP
ncbi:hypothetical protein [Spirosoma spitsbergense]|uniref:hypothetical protein n=1 Tax=Spirosoma spitsbergense TaxID=431554 RepID=UPI00036700B2|nr:hypothetical protein [Spirosoma spitsbergense]